MTTTKKLVTSVKTYRCKYMLCTKVITFSTYLIFTVGIHAAEPKLDSSETKPGNTTQAPLTDPKADLVKKNPKPEDFVGKWKGKWGGIYGVQFTISTIPDDKEHLNMIYEWEERQGQPYERSVKKVKLTGNVLKSGLIDITIMEADPNQAVAQGNFKKPRTAILTKEK